MNHPFRAAWPPFRPPPPEASVDPVPGQSSTASEARVAARAPDPGPGRSSRAVRGVARTKSASRAPRVVSAQLQRREPQPGLGGGPSTGAARCRTRSRGAVSAASEVGVRSWEPRPRRAQGPAGSHRRGSPGPRALRGAATGASQEQTRADPSVTECGALSPAGNQRSDHPTSSRRWRPAPAPARSPSFRSPSLLRGDSTRSRVRRRVRRSQASRGRGATLGTPGRRTLGHTARWSLQVARAEPPVTPGSRHRPRPRSGPGKRTSALRREEPSEKLGKVGGEAVAPSCAHLAPPRPDGSGSKSAPPFPAPPGSLRAPPRPRPGPPRSPWDPAAAPRRRESAAQVPGPQVSAARAHPAVRAPPLRPTACAGAEKAPPACAGNTREPRALAPASLLPAPSGRALLRDPRPRAAGTSPPKSAEGRPRRPPRPARCPEARTGVEGSALPGRSRAPDPR
ncbi:PREDICTED: serine/arginine repetitive matrix protein 1-like [Chinchilla lanigera]|uniref:serine/arginine repetitive matrix protein 1-like n=1 Tax=Chinchilla lanigera TaxID=34839 RepID=UPI00069751C9|nr:PREDICTED: serine/arginine repetitive matrix protein 1-like [Chinchilla lanigera]